MTYEAAKDFVFENLKDYEPPRGGFAEMVFPVIKSVLNGTDMAELMNQIVDVQPMGEPGDGLAQLFYFDFVIGPRNRDGEILR